MPDNSLIFKEWAPAAEALFLTGDFSRSLNIQSVQYFRQEVKSLCAVTCLAGKFCYDVGFRIVLDCIVYGFSLHKHESSYCKKRNVLFII